MPDLPIREGFFLPPDETIRFFRGKDYADGEYRQRWDQLWQEEHGRWFTVTKLFDTQVLEEVRRSLDRIITDGGTYEQWKRDIMRAFVDEQGRPKEDIDPRLLVSDARLRTVFDTNLRVSRAAGQWQRIIDQKDVLPYLMYSAVNDTHTRPLHRAWGGLDGGQAVVLRVDDPWWDTHYPPCGWNCRCNVIQLSERELARRGLKLTETPPDGPPQRFIRSTGEIETVPAGIDPGFAYNPGKDFMHALSPVPASGFIDRPRIIVDPERRPEMPPARTADPADLLPDDITAKEAADRLLAVLSENGTKPVFIDALGTPVAVTKRMTHHESGWLKAGKGERARYALLAARAMLDPDEIWYEWIPPDPAKEKATGKPFPPRLRRRYVARFVVDGVEKAVFAALDIGAEGWEGRTWFSPDRGAAYLDDSVRRGVLAWARNDGGPGR